MKLGSSYLILLSFSFVIFSGTAGAHPHELGKIDHGPSLESYQVDLDFTTNDSSKSWHYSIITLAKKDKDENSTKIDKSVKLQKLDMRKKIKEKKYQEQKEQ